MMVHEIFPSFQGEGVLTGLPTVFVRFAGCNLSCIWCDTEYSRNVDGASLLEVNEIVERIVATGIDRVCLTGGEPLCQKDLIILSKAILQRGMGLSVETNGSIDVTTLVGECPGLILSMDVKLPGSGMWGSFLESNMRHLRPSDQLKFVISDPSDMDSAMDLISRHRPVCNLILTPCGNEGGDAISEALKGSISRARDMGDTSLHRILLRSRLMVQTHKVIWGDRRGV